jgi:hypothetical protein
MSPATATQTAASWTSGGTSCGPAPIPCPATPATRPRSMARCGPPPRPCPTRPTAPSRSSRRPATPPSLPAPGPACTPPGPPAAISYPTATGSQRHALQPHHRQQFPGPGGGTPARCARTPRAQRGAAGLPGAGRRQRPPPCWGSAASS